MRASDRAQPRPIGYGRQSIDDGGDYLNCPFTREQYARFLEALLAAEQHRGHDFDNPNYFEACLPIEELARRGRDTLRFGPMKPVGLRDPRTGKGAYAVVQLRQEDAAPAPTTSSVSRIT